MSDAERGARWSRLVMDALGAVGNHGKVQRQEEGRRTIVSHQYVLAVTDLEDGTVLLEVTTLWGTESDYRAAVLPAFTSDDEATAVARAMVRLGT